MDRHTYTFKRYSGRGRSIRTNRGESSCERVILRERSDFFYGLGRTRLYNKNTISLLFAIGFFFLLFVECSVKNPVTDEAGAPVLSDLVAPGTVYFQSHVKYPVTVRTSDPQGWEDIKIVRYFFFPEGSQAVVGEGAMRDDGTGGDIIPMDGIFFDSLGTDFADGQAGQFLLSVVAEDLTGHFSDALNADISVIEGEINLPPVLSNPIVPDTLTEETVGNVFLSIRADDSHGVEDIDTVRFQIYPPWSPIHIYQGQLRDDGTSGDVDAGDNIFSFRGDMQGILRTIGHYSVRFQAEDVGGLMSHPIVTDFYVFRENSPPALSNLVAPDEVSRSSSPAIPLTVRVIDPEGLSDVKSVYFNTTKPDGSPSSGNPFSLFDDGTAGDVNPGDGVYSLTIYITPQNALGNYRFDFLAEDYAGAVSDTLRHIIRVVD